MTVLDVWYDQFHTPVWDDDLGEVTVTCTASDGFGPPEPFTLRMSWHQADRLRRALTATIPATLWQDPDLTTMQVAA